MYKTLPSNLTRGYSNATDFRSDFSAGKLDNRSNQVFVSLYNYDPMGFGATADDLGVTPARNMAIAGGDLISKGMNVVLDASPFATQIGYGKDIYKDGNIIADPKLPGMKKITVVDRNGRRVTKTVTVSGDEPNPVIVDMDEGNVVLEDEPANGYLILQPDKIYDEYGLSGTHEIRVRTNYLYYSSSTEEKWITTSTKTDISLVTIKLAANDTGEKRTGEVFVYGTNKDGKVLKKEVINITQEPKPAKGDIIWTEPAAVAFDADGGKQNIVVGHYPGYSFIGCMEGSDLAGWCYLETAESPAGEPTYTIKADPNTTGEERSGIVTFYASNSNSALENVLYNNAKPDGETVAETTVIIKQKAGEKKEESLISSIEVDFKIHSQIGTEGDDYGMWSEVNDNFYIWGESNGNLKSNINVDKKEKSYHVSGLYEGVSEKDEKYTIEFDLSYDGNSYGNITNLKITGDSKYSSGDYAGSGKKYTLNASTIPVNYDSWFGTYWGCKKKEGFVISSFECDSYLTDGSIYHFSYSGHDDDWIKIYIRWH